MTTKVKRLISAIVSFALMLTVLATPLGDIVGVTKDSVGTTASADSYWVGSSKYGYYANNSTALNEVKAVMSKNCSSSEISRFNKILSEFPLSGYFNSYKTKGCSWHCANCESRTQLINKGCRYTFYDDETGSTIPCTMTGWNNAIECAGYAVYCYYRFFGKTTADTLKLKGFDVSTLKSFFTNNSIRTGAHVRISGHSMCYLTRDDNYIYFIDANSGYNSATGCIKGSCGHYATCCKINLRKFTYADFVNKTSSNGITVYNSKESKFDHTHSYTSSVTTSATCTSAGVRTYKCSCGSSYTESIAALGHNYGSWSTATSATCTSGGTEKRTCSRCGNSETRSTSALGHSYGSTFYEAAHPHYYGHKCTRCGYGEKTGGNLDYYYLCDTCTHLTVPTVTKLTPENPVAGDTVSVSWTPSSSDKLSHYWIAIYNPSGECILSELVDKSTPNYSYKVTEIGIYKFSISATPLKSPDGSGSKHASVTVNVHTHTYGTWSTTKAATCTEDGEMIRTCSSCGETETETIDALGHNYVTSVVKPTCTVEGYTLHTCSVCGDSYKDNYTDKLVLSAVTGLAITPTSMSSLTLSWDKNDNATGYYIQQYKNGEWTHIRQLARNTVTTYTATGLAPFTKYQFRIRAYYTDGSTTVYSDYKAVSETTRPSKMTGVSVTSTAKSVTINWDQNDTATGYLIQQYKDGEWKHIRQLARNTVTTYTATGLEPSTKYQYRIRAYYTDGPSTAYSNYFTLAPTTRPTNLTGIKASSTANSITFSWDKNSSATGYFVQQYKNGAWTHVRQLARNTATTYTATGLNPSTKYQYRIRAYYTDGTTTTYSDYKYVSPTTRPTNLTGMKASSTANSITFSWDKNNTATGYFIQQYKDGKWTHVRQLARNTATTFTASGLNPSTKYQYRIRAYYTDGTTTTYSDYKYVSPTTRPTNLTGVKVTSTSNTVTLSWDKNDSATGYFIQQYKNGVWTHVRQLARNTVLSYTATGLTPSTTYQFRIRAYYTDGTTTTYSDYTQTLTVTTKA